MLMHHSLTQPPGLALMWYFARTRQRRGEKKKLNNRNRRRSHRGLVTADVPSIGDRSAAPGTARIRHSFRSTRPCRSFAHGSWNRPRKRSHHIGCGRRRHAASCLPRHVAAGRSKGCLRTHQSCPLMTMNASRIRHQG
jgi:hypothetical protein